MNAVRRRSRGNRVIALIVTLMLIVGGCTTDGKAGRSTFTLQQIWNPASLDREILFDFSLDPKTQQCQDALEQRVCSWNYADQINTFGFEGHLYSALQSLDTMRKQDHLTEFRPVAIPGGPALQYRIKTDSPNYRCNIAWGTDTGSMSTGLARDARSTVDLCTVTKLWTTAVRNSLHRTDPNQEPPAGTRSLWDPQQANPALMRMNLKLDYCRKSSASMTECRWYEPVPPIEKVDGKIVRVYANSMYNVRIATFSSSFDQFKKDRNYIELAPVKVGGTEGVRYSISPGMRTVAWPYKGSTVLAKSAYGRAKGTNDERPINLCEKAESAARAVAGIAR